MSYLEDRRKWKQFGKPKEEKPVYRMPKFSKKKLAEMEANKKAVVKPAGKLELDVWFNEIERKVIFGDLGTYCQECKAWIPKQFIRHATAHLLPKKLFVSVATHELNYMIYGAGCGCHEKTHRVDKFVQMKTFPEAARKIKIMLPLLPIDELRHVSNQLLIALDNI